MDFVIQCLPVILEPWTDFAAAKSYDLGDFALLKKVKINLRLF